MSDTVTITETSQTVTVTPAGGQTVTATTAAAQTVTISAVAAYTDAQARQAVSATGTGLSYNNSTGVITSLMTSAATSTKGISDTNVLECNANVADNDFLRIDGTKVEGRTASETLSDIGAQAALTFGISNTNAVKVDSASVADDEYARFTANGLESRSTSEVLSDIGAAASAHTHADAYTGQIETAADKTYTIDPGAVSARTITGFYIKSASGTCTANLKVGSSVVKAASVSSSSGDQTSLANTSVSVNDVITLVVSSNSSALDVIFSVEYTA